MTNPSELLLCPFCKGKLKIIESARSDYGYDLICTNEFVDESGMTAHCPLGGHGFLDESNLTKKANTRPIESALNEQIREQGELIERLSSALVDVLHLIDEHGSPVIKAHATTLLRDRNALSAYATWKEKQK